MSSANIVTEQFFIAFSKWSQRNAGDRDTLVVLQFLMFTTGIPSYLLYNFASFLKGINQDIELPVLHSVMLKLITQK